MGDTAPKLGSLVTMEKMDHGTVGSGKLTIISSRVDIITIKGSRARMAAKGSNPQGSVGMNPVKTWCFWGRIEKQLIYKIGMSKRQRGSHPHAKCNLSPCFCV